MDPVCSFDEENVITKPYDVGDLEHEENVPCCWSISRIVECNDAGNKLRRDNAEACAIGNPAKNVCSSAAITL
jgi:hypothetical protein